MIFLTIFLIINTILLFSHIKQYFMINQEFYLNRNNEDFMNEMVDQTSEQEMVDQTSEQEMVDQTSEQETATQYDSDLQMSDSEPETEPDMS